MKLTGDSDNPPEIPVNASARNKYQDFEDQWINRKAARNGTQTSSNDSFLPSFWATRPDSTQPRGTLKLLNDAENMFI